MLAVALHIAEAVGADPRAGVLNTYAKCAAPATQFYNRSGLTRTT